MWATTRFAFWKDSCYWNRRNRWQKEGLSDDCWGTTPQRILGNRREVRAKKRATEMEKHGESREISLKWKYHSNFYSNTHIFQKSKRSKTSTLNKQKHILHIVKVKFPCPRVGTIKASSSAVMWRLLQCLKKHECVAGVSNLLASLGHTRGRRVVLGHTLNVKTLMETDQQKKTF